MISYTADKYDSYMKLRVGSHQRFRMGRDIRVFLIFLGAVINQPLAALIVIAVMMNVEAVRRIIACRDGV